SGVAVGVRGNHIAPVGELRAITGRHVLKILGHSERKVVACDDLRVGLSKLRELLDKLAVAKNCVCVVRGVVNDSKAELSGGGADAQPDNKQHCKDSLFHGVLSLREKSGTR